jgi:hypothetical protein
MTDNPKQGVHLSLAYWGVFSDIKPSMHSMTNSIVMENIDSHIIHTLVISGVINVPKSLLLNQFSTQKTSNQTIGRIIWKQSQ